MLAAPAPALLYRVTDLGELPFYSQTVQAVGINDFGTVCGQTLGGGGGFNFVWDRQNGIRRLGPALFFAMTGDSGRMNNLGQIVGWTRWPVDGRVTGHQPFVWSPTGGYRILPRLPGRLGGEPTGINDLGQIVGYSIGDPVKAWLWDPSTGLTDLGALEQGAGSSASDINVAGTVAGHSNVLVRNTYRGRAIRWTRAGGMENLGLLSGYDDSAASDINDEGAIVGYCLKLGLPDRSFVVRLGGTMESLGQVAGQSANDAEAINDRGEVVGMTFGFHYQSVFLYRPGEGMYDLKDLLESGSRGWSFINAPDINSSEAIVGMGMIDGHQHGYIAERID